MPDVVSKKNEEMVLKKSAEGDFAIMILSFLKLQLHHTLDNNLFLYCDFWMEAGRASLIGYFVLSKKIQCPSLLYFRSPINKQLTETSTTLNMGRAGILHSLYKEAI